MDIFTKNNDSKVVCDNNEPARRELCYISVVALFFAIFIILTPSAIKDLIKLSVLTFVIATVSLIRFKISNVKRRGKVLAIVAFALSLLYLIFLFIALAIRTSKGS